MTHSNPPTPPLPPGLYLIATPIGNLGDLSARARATLAAVDLLYAEDTRHSINLLRQQGIARQLSACHEHNEESLAAQICQQIQAGKSCGLITDAGTPGISDPGFRLVRACRRASLPVVPIPGPNAAITALSASGLPTDRFHFFGFLPPKSAARLRSFEEFRDAPDTLIFYESTHRIEKFLLDAEAVFGAERIVCVARELTKLHESILTGPLGQVRAHYVTASNKGEFVILIAKEGFHL